MGGGGAYSSGAAGVHVVRRVSHEQGTGCRQIQPAERQQHGLRKWFVALGLLEGHDGVEGALEPDMLERSRRHAASFTGDEGRGVPLGPRPGDGVEHAGIGGREPRQMNALIVAIAFDQHLHLGLAVAPLGQLRAQRRPDPRYPLCGSRCAFATLKSESHGLEEQFDGVDQGAVEVEQERES